MAHCYSAVAETTIYLEIDHTKSNIGYVTYVPVGPQYKYVKSHLFEIKSLGIRYVHS